MWVYCGQHARPVATHHGFCVFPGWPSPTVMVGDEWNTKRSGSRATITFTPSDDGCPFSSCFASKTCAGLCAVLCSQDLGSASERSAR
ncbi:hypothetical protein BJV74DRAFT_842562 [Russula compacta]|nr:hypothetical protein BJV74DRAFT_842562 [Russula compacta]